MFTIEKAAWLHEIAWQAGPERFTPSSFRTQIFVGLLTTVFEHHDSTLLLLRTGKNDASAFALARVLVEAFYRGLWLYLCATDDQVEQVRTGGAPYPKFIDITQAVDKSLGGKGKSKLGSDIWKSLNGFTHTGIEQLSRRFNTNGELVPDYDVDVIIELLTCATLSVSIMSQFLCVVSKLKDDADQINRAWSELFT